jgi:cytolysin (calcineurin-like family phosphatase)
LLAESSACPLCPYLTGWLSTECSAWGRISRTVTHQGAQAPRGGGNDEFPVPYKGRLLSFSKGENHREGHMGSRAHQYDIWLSHRRWH